jgi:hypothetical protein
MCDQIMRQLDELQMLLVQPLSKADPAREPVVDEDRGVVE